MRNSEKGELTHLGNDVFGINFRDLIGKEPNEEHVMETASEFGVSLRNVKKLRKHLNRS